jgi:hypothetical protein
LALIPSYTVAVADYEPSAFNRAVIHVLDHMGSVPMTRLHKLLYLADLEYFLEHGQTLTGAPWVREKFGPMNRAMLPALKAMSDHEVAQDTRQTRLNRTVHLILKGPSPRYEALLSPDQSQVLDRILAMTRRLSDDEVIGLAYATTPMRVLQGREKREGHALLNVPIDFAQLTDPAQIETESETEPDFEARAADQSEAMSALAPYLERALTGAGS